MKTDIYLGCSLETFKEKYKGQYRIVKNNGINYIITCDFKPERLNLEVNNNIITNITTG